MNGAEKTAQSNHSPSSLNPATECSPPSERLANARKHESVARLVTECERIIARGCLNEIAERRLRELANEACVAHEMHSIAERATLPVRVGDHQSEVSPQRSIA